MKPILLIPIAAATLASSQAAVIVSFDFAGAQNNATFNTATSTFEEVGIQDSTLTRGAGIGNNNAGDAFRGTGFSNDGIALTNTDYFQFTVSASAGSLVTINSITAKLQGTDTYRATPGVTMQWGYSFNGTDFTLASGTFSTTTNSAVTYSFSGADATALTNVQSATFRFYATGQTPSGGWGFQSAPTPGTVGLSVDGIVTTTPVPEPSTALLGGLGLLALLRRRRA